MSGVDPSLVAEAPFGGGPSFTAALAGFAATTLAGTLLVLLLATL